jgi:Polymerase beta, Nucleotidyltransferase
MQPVPFDAEALRRSFPELRLLMLHGSRARGDAHAGSDWDFAYLADAGVDELALRATLAQALHTDAVDVADLARAGAVLRYQAARDGQQVLERDAGELERFRLAAIRFWLEVEPLLTESHTAVLERLG